LRRKLQKLQVTKITTENWFSVLFAAKLASKKAFLLPKGRCQLEREKEIKRE